MFKKFLFRCTNNKTYSQFTFNAYSNIRVKVFQIIVKKSTKTSKFFKIKGYFNSKGTTSINNKTLTKLCFLHL